MLAIKEVELSIVVPVKGQPGRCVGTLVRRVHSDMSLPEIIKGVRKEIGTETEGCIYLDPENYRQSVHDWNIRQSKIKAQSIPEKIYQDALVEDLEDLPASLTEAHRECSASPDHGYTCQD